ncbi:MAG: fibronectin type III domain-containing protein, partial [Candidatus Uhrbacteria bacterium]|nr:fibronectin type III domain-containing protein [Candidatus Uhrbacteria bacterium]
MRIFRRMIQTLTLAAVVTTAAVVGAWSVSAATVSSANDYPSTLQTSQVSNHRVLFTTSTGISEGSTFTLTFASSFDTSTITEDDIDITDDGTDLTTAATCGGVEQASVAIASDVVTITICAGDGGAIAGTSSVAIEIGTNATSSGTGTSQITNPSSTGNYYVSVAGTFGDSGSIILPIGGDDSFSVTATVPEGGGHDPCEGCDPGETDTTAPDIFNIVVSDETTSSAVISWETNEPATRVLDYGLTTDFELDTVSDLRYYTSHSVTLTGLLEGTTYYFQIWAADFAGNAATSSTQSFITLDDMAPEISNIEVVDITMTSARVTWETNEQADSTVAYGLTDSYTDSEPDEGLVTEHSIHLTDLVPGTTYHFQVLSTDASSNQAFSDDETFSTDSDDFPGNVSNLSIVEGDEELTLTWTNPADDDLAGILVLQCLGGYPTNPSDASCTTVSTALVTAVLQTDLTNGTT